MKNNMENKIQVITGKPATGKTVLAEKMAISFDNVSFINGRNLKNSYVEIHESISEKTDLIIIDDVPVSCFDKLVFFFKEDFLQINKRHSKSIKIATPRVVITTSDALDYSKIDKNIKCLCDFIETSIDRKNESKNGK